MAALYSITSCYFLDFILFDHEFVILWCSLVHLFCIHTATFFLIKLFYLPDLFIIGNVPHELHFPLYSEILGLIFLLNNYTSNIR